jgi:hypothetical protein
MDADFLQLLAHLGRGSQFQYYWRSSDKMSRWFPTGQPAEIRPDAANYYFGIHGSTQAKSSGQRAEIVDIAAVNCLFAEFDAKDYDGSKSGCLSAIEPQAPSVIIDSGGGYHGYWLLVEPFLIHSEEKRKRIQDIQRRWVGCTQGDDGAKDLARVLRIPGTLNVKYDPARPVTVLQADFDLLYDLDILEAMLPPVPPVVVPPPCQATHSSAYGQKALLSELGKLAMTRDGNRNQQLFKSAANLAEVCAGGYLALSAVEAELLTVAIRTGLTENESRDTIESGIKHGQEKPRQAKERPTPRYKNGPVVWSRLT